MMGKEEGKQWRQYVIAIIAVMSTLCTGYIGGLVSPLEGKLEDINQSPLPEPISRTQASWIGSLMYIGAIIGPTFGGIAAKTLGRKWGIMMAWVPTFVAWVLTAAAVDINMIYAGRFLFGLSLGVFSTVIPMYNGEIAQKETRGALGSLLPVSIVVGMLLAYSVGPFVTYSGICYVGVSLSAVAAVSFYLMPESPSYYLSKGDRESAKESLIVIRGKSSLGVEEELDQLAVEIAEITAVKAKFSDLWATRGNVRGLCICCGMLALQPFTGVTAVLTYTETIFRAAGMELDPVVSTILLGLFQVLGSLITPFVVDRLGRRMLLITSAVGSSIAMSLLAVYFSLDHNENPVVSSIGYLPVIAMILYIISYNFGIGPVPWALLGELFPINVRATAAPIVTVVAWGTAFIVARYFYTVVDAIGMHYALWIFTGTSISFIFFASFIVPETKGKSFQEIQDIMNGRKPMKAILTTSSGEK